MARSTFVYASYIRTTPEKLWSALTDVAFIKQYWFGVQSESEWNGGQAHHHPQHRARALEVHRGGVGRLAEGHFQPEVAARDRRRRSAGSLSRGERKGVSPTLKGI